MRNEREKKGNEGKDERERGKEEKEREMNMIYGGAYSKIHYGICTVICILKMGPLPSLLTSSVLQSGCLRLKTRCLTRKPLFFHLVSHLLLEK